MPRKIVVQYIASQMAPFVHVRAVHQRGHDALEDSHVADADCVYPNKRRKGSTSNALAGNDFDADGPQQQLLGHFSELVFAANAPTQVCSENQMTGKKSPTSVTTLSSTITNQPYGHAEFTSAYDPTQTSSSHPNQLALGVDGLNSANVQIMQQDQFVNAPLTAPFNSDFVGGPSTYDYNAFDEPLNWIPPSLIPSPYDAELEQDFSFILPPLSATPNLGPDYNMAIPLDSAVQIYQVGTDIPQDMSENHGFSASVIGVEQSPASSASDGINVAISVNTVSTSESKRKKRKSSFAPDLFNTPRRQRTTYAFPHSSDPLSTIPPTDSREYCSPATYEAILELFRKLCLDQSSQRSFERPDFPNMSSFNACVGLYFEHFHSNYPLVHRASFGHQTHWIVMLAVAAIGSTFTKAQYALDIREAFQEFLRRAVQQYADGVLDVALDVPLAQARSLNLVGLVQSERNQLRYSAPRYHADLSRWCLESGVLQLLESDDFSDSMLTGVDSESPYQAWQEWIRAETLRRIGYLTWMLDCCLGYMANARPLCNMDDARTPLPCVESAWEASSAETWTDVMRRIPKTPSLCVALETLYKNKKVDPNYSELSQTLLIHALYIRTWEVGTHIKQPLSEWVPTGKARGFLNTPSKDNFWLPLYPLYANWRNSACDCLDVLHWQASSVVAHASGVEHGVMLHLHLARIILLTPFQEIQDLLFSLIGKVGNSSKASFYVHDGSYQPRNSAKLPQIRKITWRWLREDQHKARLAMVHAGSVFWYVRRYSANSFYEPIAVYLAALVLWTYGSYKSSALERDAAAGIQKPEGGPSGPDAGAAIQPSRMERKGRPVKFMNNVANRNGSDTQPTSSPPARQLSDAETVSTSEPNKAADPSASSPLRSSASDSEETSSSDEQPEFIHLDRPCDDEMIQHFVRNGESMSGFMTGVGNICETPQKVLLEGAKLLRTRLSCWGVSREYYDILTKLAELRKAG
ncbi:hypothetical protein LTR67_005707 [Exophiala xenobiotica]